MPKQLLSQRYNTTTLTIANGAAISSAFNVGGERGRGFSVQTPVAWTAANIGLEVSEDNSTYIPLYDEFGSRVQITGVTVDEVKVYMFPAAAWAVGVYNYARLVSVNTSTGANVNQGASRTLIMKALV